MSEVSRVTRSKASARRTYDGMSRWYDLFASSEKKFTNEGLKMLAVSSGEKVLEIGFGTGDALLSLARDTQPELVYAIDLSPKMRAVAERKLEHAALGARVRFETGDAVNLPYTDDFFDAVFMSFTLELFDTPEIPRVLAACKRVLKKDGRLGVVALEKEARLSVRIYEWFHQQLHNLVDCRPIYTEESLAQAGFTVSKKKLLRMWGLPVNIVVAMRTP